MKIAGIYLAAGNSQRMGKSKLKLKIGHTSLGSIALQTVLQSSLNKVYIIVSKEDACTWIAEHLKNDMKCQILLCKEADEGQAASIRCGVYQALQEKMDAVIIFLADQPFITTEIIERLIATFLRSKTALYVSFQHKGVIYPPVIFSKYLFPHLLRLKGDQGAKKLLENKKLTIGKCIPVSDWQQTFDIDTKEDFQTYTALINKQK